MTVHRCAMPECPKEATGIFCPDHYIALPAKDALWLVRWQIKTMRCQDAEEKAYRLDQLHSYTQEAIRKIQSAEAISQAAPASARRQSTSQAAGANQHSGV